MCRYVILSTTALPMSHLLRKEELGEEKNTYMYASDNTNSLTSHSLLDETGGARGYNAGGGSRIFKWGALTKTSWWNLEVFSSLTQVIKL